LTRHTSSRSRNETDERVPWNVILQRYGEVEASRRLLQNSIEHRMDPEGENEHQFRITRVVDRRCSNCFVATATNIKCKA